MSDRALAAVLFDLDGTLADSMAAIAKALVETLATFGHATTVEQVMPAFGPSMADVIERVVHADRAEAERIYEAYLPRYYRDYMPRSRPLPGAGDLVAGLGGRVALAIVSSKIEAGARSLVELLGWSEHFAVVVGRDTTNRIKPSPEPVLYALSELRVEAARAAFVGDTEEDMQAAAAAGVSTVVGLAEIRGERELRAAGATHVCANLAAVRRLLDALVPAPTLEPRA